MKKTALCIFLLSMASLFLAACGGRQDQDTGKAQPRTEESGTADEADTPGETADIVTAGSLPDELAEIPDGYYGEAARQGTLANLYYDTYESMTYEEGTTTLTKRAVVYLPYGYSEDQSYNVFYLMHGGWSDETTYLGTPDSPAPFKNVLDHVMAAGAMAPMIVVCPTYNNTSSQDSGIHSGEYALQYFYNGMCWIWK